MATKSRTARSVPLGRGARRTRRGPGVAAGGGGGAAQECRVHFLAADTIILHLRARRQPTASTPAVQAALASLHPPYAAGSTATRLPAAPPGGRLGAPVRHRLRITSAWAVRQRSKPGPFWIMWSAFSPWN